MQGNYSTNRTTTGDMEADLQVDDCSATCSSRKQDKIFSDNQVNKKPNKMPRYMQSVPIQPIIHPVDRNILWSFLLSVIFVVIAIITGIPFVMFLTLLIPLVLFIRHACAKYCYCRSGNRGGCGNKKLHFLSAVDAFWLHDSDFNRFVSHCIFFVERGMNAEKLRELVLTRVISKQYSMGLAFPRFTQKISPVSTGYCWVEDENFALKNHIFEEHKRIGSKRELEDHLTFLMGQPMSQDRPLWEIRVVPNFGKARDTVFLFRVHLAVSDGISFVKILGNCLADSRHNLRLKPRYGGTTFPFNIFRALMVGPLTFLTWLLYFRRDCNLLQHSQRLSGERVVSWSRNIRFSKIQRIKQITRSSINDVLLSAVTGSLRAYFQQNGVEHPPDVTMNIPVDLRFETTMVESVPEMGNRYAIVNTRLPTNTEGAIPRLWEVRHLMEDLKTSADSVVMYGAVHYLFNLLPYALASWLFRVIHRKATLIYSNLPGPDDAVFLGSHRLKKITFWMNSSVEVPVSISVFSYGGSINLSVAADKMVIPNPKVIVREFNAQINHLSRLLSKRRIPGEHRRRSSFTAERRREEILKPPLQQIEQKLHDVQDELREITLRMEEASNPDYSPSEFRQLTASREYLSTKVEELKEEFSELLMELRRRKSLADGRVSTEDEDNDGLLRRSRKRALSITGRRPSLSAVTSSIMSTARPLTTPTTPHHSIFIPPSPEMDHPESPSSDQHRSLLLDGLQYPFKYEDFIHHGS
ncbi:putative diacylglycerol O-acyltransferase tgs1 isoform X2 [Tachypleus tridentatus]|uniref:putative diacylglycerol O-acyltransferase tgs1 isoform X2 n=1 Tax=Tachypleus tridentatus TaxID=6853 RepID=UPI003FD6B3E3